MSVAAHKAARAELAGCRGGVGVVAPHKPARAELAGRRGVVGVVRQAARAWQVWWGTLSTA